MSRNGRWFWTILIGVPLVAAIIWALVADPKLFVRTLLNGTTLAALYFVVASGFTLTGGQMWSLVTETGLSTNNRTEKLPNTIDAQYTVGFSWARQAAIRIQQTFGNVKTGMFTAAVSLENADCDVLRWMRRLVRQGVAILTERSLIRGSRQS